MTVAIAKIHAKKGLLAMRKFIQSGVIHFVHLQLRSGVNSTLTVACTYRCKV